VGSAQQQRAAGVALATSTPQPNEGALRIKRGSPPALGFRAGGQHGAEGSDTRDGSQILRSTAVGPETNPRPPPSHPHCDEQHNGENNE
jgi:hypothetical protein